MPRALVLRLRAVRQPLTLFALAPLVVIGSAGLLTACATAETTASPTVSTDGPAQTETPSAAPLDAEKIRAVQRRLQALNYDPGPIDGIVGARTISAVRAFQSRAGLATDGVINQTLLARLQQPDSPPFPADANLTTKGNTTVTGPLALQRNAAGKLTGCAINDVSFELSWCQPFAQKTAKDNASCKAVLRPNGQVLLLRCG